MLKLTQTRRINWPVIVTVPQDGGAVAKQKINVQYEILPTSVVETLTVKELLRQAVGGWDGITDESGTAIPFSAEALEMVIDVPYIRSALTESYFQAASGKAAEKN